MEVRLLDLDLWLAKETAEREIQARNTGAGHLEPASDEDEDHHEEEQPAHLADSVVAARKRLTGTNVRCSHAASTLLLIQSEMYWKSITRDRAASMSATLHQCRVPGKMAERYKSPLSGETARVLP